MCHVILLGTLKQEKAELRDSNGIFNAESIDILQRSGLTAVESRWPRLSRQCIKMEFALGCDSLAKNRDSTHRPSCEGRPDTFLLPASDHAHDIPILKQAKAKYAKLQ